MDIVPMCDNADVIMVILLFSMYVPILVYEFRYCAIMMMSAISVYCIFGIWFKCCATMMMSPMLLFSIYVPK